jgi:hypothetical protein
VESAKFVFNALDLIELFQLQEWVLDQLEFRSITVCRAEILARSVSRQDKPTLKISVQMVNEKWEIISDGGEMQQAVISDATVG